MFLQKNMLSPKTFFSQKSICSSKPCVHKKNKFSPTILFSPNNQVFTKKKHVLIKLCFKKNMFTKNHVQTGQTRLDLVPSQSLP